LAQTEIEECNPMARNCQEGDRTTENFQNVRELLDDRVIMFLIWEIDGAVRKGRSSFFCYITYTMMLSIATTFVINSFPKNSY
jgi:hypothetical protein